jgi:transcriptional regulator with XRE-family HTH domain
MKQSGTIMIGVDVMKYDFDTDEKEREHPKSASYAICEDIINELIQMRQDNHLSQYQLAERCGVKQPMTYRIENGINTPNMSTVLKLLAAFGKTLYIGDMNGTVSETPQTETDDEADLGDADAAAGDASTDGDETA